MKKSSYPKRGDLLQIMYHTPVYKHPVSTNVHEMNNTLASAGGIAGDEIVLVLDETYTIKVMMFSVLNIKILHKNITGWITINEIDVNSRYKKIA